MPERPGGRGDRHPEPASLWEQLLEHRRQLDDRRRARAATVAGPMIADLVRTAGIRAGSDIEDELCIRIGRALGELEDPPLEGEVDPDTLVMAVLDAAVAAVSGTVSGPAGGSVDSPADAWTSAWRVLIAVRDILPFPLRGTASELIGDLCEGVPDRMLPEPPAGPTLAGAPLWCRDVYGSRFGVFAPLLTGDGPIRWYLWDIDACGYAAFTVHSRYHATKEEALGDWRAGAGSPGADGSALTPVEDPMLLEELMPRLGAGIRPGGESVAQFAEYHRCRRLAEAVTDEAAGASRWPDAPADLDTPSAAAGLFAAWLRKRRPDWPASADLDERTAELADSWQIDGPAALFGTCSPHRVAHAVEHIRNFYEDDFAADLVALLPDWVVWLCERNGIPVHLADRCRPYAHGELHKAVRADDGRPDYLARITE